MELLTPGTGLIFWQIVIFLGLFFVLSKLAWKPILTSLKEREASIQQALDSADKARAEMANLQVGNEKLLKEAREERDKILREARDAANRLHDEAQENSKRNADRLIQDAKSVIQSEKEAALRDVRELVAKFSLEVAEKVIKKNLATDKSQQELAQGFAKEIKLN
jgi:F-type H+-transporting ATPase subunit b